MDLQKGLNNVIFDLFIVGGLWNYECTVGFRAISNLAPRMNSIGRLLDNYTRTCNLRFGRRKREHDNVWGMLHLGADDDADANG